MGRRWACARGAQHGCAAALSIERPLAGSVRAAASAVSAACASLYSSAAPAALAPHPPPLPCNLAPLPPAADRPRLLSVPGPRLRRGLREPAALPAGLQAAAVRPAALQRLCGGDRADGGVYRVWGQAGSPWMQPSVFVHNRQSNLLGLGPGSRPRLRFSVDVHNRQHSLLGLGSGSPPQLQFSVVVYNRQRGLRC